MSANDTHESPIKTPTQLVTVLVLAFVVPIIIIVLLVHLVTGGMRYEKNSLEMSAEEIAKRIRPVANVNIEAAARSGPTSRTGEDIYKSVCTACHATGVANAPKFGNQGDWAPRIKTGQKALLQSALKGKGAMPPRGGAADLSDAEVEGAVVYMANAGGANFKEPVAAAPAAGGKRDGRVGAAK